MTDDQAWLRERLAAADPARNLTAPRTLEPPENTMSTSTTPRGRVSRTRIALAAAAAGVVVAAGVGLLVDNGEPAPAPHRAAPGKALTSATFTLDPAAGAARCMTPTVNGIRQLDVAFRGKVVGRGDHSVTLAPSTFFTGARTDRVVLDVTGAERADSELLPVRFTVGQDYIVGVAQGKVRLCGYTAPANAGLQALYDRALGAPS